MGPGPSTKSARTSGSPGTSRKGIGFSKKAANSTGKKKGLSIKAKQ